MVNIAMHLESKKYHSEVKTEAITSSYSPTSTKLCPLYRGRQTQLEGTSESSHSPPHFTNQLYRIHYLFMSSLHYF